MDISSESPLCYVGPTITAIGLRRFAVFQSLPPHVADLMGRSPALRALMVPADRLVQARRELSEKGSLLSIMQARLVGELNLNR